MKRLLFAILLLASPVYAADPDTTGLESLRQAAEQGNVDAQYELGILYEFGYRFHDHKVAAYAWYNHAAEKGNALAAKRRDALKAQLSGAELQRAQTFLKTEPAPAPAPTATTR